MHSSSLLVLLGGLALTGAAPATNADKSAVLQIRQFPPIAETLVITFWEKEGCTGKSSTNEVHHTIGENKPGDCIENINEGWQYVTIQQPRGAKHNCTVALFSGNGCTNVQPGPPVCGNLSLC